MTADLTLFTKEDIETAETLTSRGLGTLKERAAHTGIVGIWFGSLKEGRRYIELRHLEIAGAITGLTLQPRFPLEITHTGSGKNTIVGAYVADFEFYDVASGTPVIEDSKGVRTPMFTFKRKLVEALYDITITET